MGHALLPCGLVAIDRLFIGGVDRLRQQLIESRTLQADRQRYLLSWLATPPAAILHPEKIGLDPAHSGERELTAEVAVAGCEMPDGGPVGLVDDDRYIVVLSQNVPPGCRPAGGLNKIWFSYEMHMYWIPL